MVNVNSKQLAANRSMDPYSTTTT